MVIGFSNIYLSILFFETSYFDLCKILYSFISLNREKRRNEKREATKGKGNNQSHRWHEILERKKKWKSWEHSMSVEPERLEAR